VEVSRGQVAEPKGCAAAGCGAKGQMVLSHNLSIFSDKQLVKLQETPDAIPEGETPHTVNLLAYDDLVDIGKPGTFISNYHEQNK
jgi:DNA replication licensing factor MCM4